MSIKRQLFFNNLYRRRCGPSSAGPADSDKFTQTYGSIVPHSIPESTSWWKQQKFELQAICDDGEAGIMQAMVPSRSESVCLCMITSLLQIDLCDSTQNQQRFLGDHYAQ